MNVQKARSANRLLSLLSVRDYERLRPHLRKVKLKYKDSLYESGKTIGAVYFLEEGVASNVIVMENGHSVEIGAIGNEGVVGLPIILGDTQGTTSAYMQVPGEGLRMSAKLFWQQMESSKSLRLKILHYAHAYSNLLAQTGACGHLHTLDQRCCRWLLMTHDRVHNDQFLLTQEFLAMMLGVRRAGVTVAADALRKAGLIEYSRGHVTILDYEGLRRRSCECYDISKLEFDRLLGEKPMSANKAKDIRRER